MHSNREGAASSSNLESRVWNGHHLYGHTCCHLEYLGRSGPRLKCVIMAGKHIATLRAKPEVRIEIRWRTSHRGIEKNTHMRSSGSASRTVLATELDRDAFPF